MFFLKKYIFLLSKILDNYIYSLEKWSKIQLLICRKKIKSLSEVQESTI